MSAAESADAPPPRAAARSALAATAAVPGAAKPDPILTVEGILRRFGGLTAVDVDHLEVQRGCITALIGPNGAGKTTLFNLLTGFDRADAGRWSFDGAAAGGRPAHRVARMGMVRTFQLTRALSRLSVLDNVRMGASGQRGESLARALVRGSWRRQEAAVTERAYGLLERFGLAEMHAEFAGSLSGGQRKLLEMARALMTDPRLIMLDEPMAGVNPVLMHSLLEHVRALRDEGMTVVFVEHDMDVVREVSDWTVVMAGGRVVAEGAPTQVMADPAVIDAYLGSHHEEPLSIDDEDRRGTDPASIEPTDPGGER